MERNKMGEFLEMKPTIIIPTRNNLKCLKIALESLYQSTDYPFDLIVMVNQCTDKTYLWMQKFKESHKGVKVFLTNMSRIDSINSAIEKCKGDVYLTHDDMFFNRCLSLDWLKELHDRCQEENIGLGTTLDGGGISGEEYTKGLNWVGTWSMYIPKHTINKVGLFDPEILIGDDIDYTYRVYKAGLIFGTLRIWHEHHQLRQNKESYIPHSDEDRIIDAQKFRRKHGLEKNSN
jgi:glycosyltransferase involved in cell wall biosynthesis